MKIIPERSRGFTNHEKFNKGHFRRALNASWGASKYQGVGGRYCLAKRSVLKARKNMDMIPEVKQKEANSNHKGTKSEPKCDQKSMRVQGHVLGVSSWRSGCNFGTIWSRAQQALG